MVTFIGYFYYLFIYYVTKAAQQNTSIQNT